MNETQRLENLLAGGNGGYPFIGTPDDCAAEMKKICAIGIDGLALGFVNGLKYFPYLREELLPRLERLGLRTTARNSRNSSA